MELEPHGGEALEFSKARLRHHNGPVFQIYCNHLSAVHPAMLICLEPFMSYLLKS